MNPYNGPSVEQWKRLEPEARKLILDMIREWWGKPWKRDESEWPSATRAMAILIMEVDRLTAERKETP
jgi:hypothetical protein